MTTTLGVSSQPGFFQHPNGYVPLPENEQPIATIAAGIFSKDVSPESPSNLGRNGDDAQPIQLTTEPIGQERTATVAEKFFPGNLRRELPDNLGRDIVWTAASATDANITASNSSAGPTTTQWTLGTLPMVVLAVSEIAYRKYKGEEVPYAKIAAPVIAASLAIPAWDFGQKIGTDLGARSFPSSHLFHGASIAGGMMAAPFTGAFEGFAQWGTKYAVDLATNEGHLRDKWSKKPRLMAKLLFKEFLLNITIGAIPGAVWQIVYFFVLPVLLAASGPWGILIASLIVGLAVMLCNFACTHAINAVSSRIDTMMGWDRELRELEEEIRRELAEAEIERTEQLDENFLPQEIPA